MKKFLLDKIRKSLIIEQRIKFNISVPKDITLIKEVFKKHGHKVFLVGGSVRDAVLGKTPKDWDLATDAVPDKVIEMLRGQFFVHNILETGKSFGVVNVITETDEFEIATFRSDSKDGDGRRPDSVQFTDIETDVKRRDLTINALFFDIDTNEIVDLVGGLSDIKNGVVRTVGSAEDRFDEDRLRILRAIRFAARFGSGLDPEVEKALQNDSSLEKISNERIRDEFLKGIKSVKSVKHFLEMLDKFDLFKWIFKGMNVNKAFVEERDPLVLISFLLSPNSVSDVQSGLHKMTYTINEIRLVSFLVSLGQLTPEHSFSIKKAQALSAASDEQIRKSGNQFKINTKLLDTFINFKLSVSGQDVMNSGIKAGPEIGKEIQRLEIEKFKDSLSL